MKKSILYITLLTLFLLLILVGCSKSEKPVDSLMTENEISTISEVKKIYDYSDNSNLSIKEIAGILLSKMMEDLKAPDSNRTFVIVDYKDITYSILDKNSEDIDLVGVTLDDNTWYLTGEVSVTYTGSLSPIGNYESVPNNEYVTVDIGERYIIKDNQSYTLYDQSKININK